MGYLSVSFFIMQHMLDQQDQFAASIASEAVEILEDHLLFPGGYLLPLSARGSGVPGMADRPWSRLSAEVFFPNLPVMYSLSMRRAPPDVLRGSLRSFPKPFYYPSHRHLDGLARGLFEFESTGRLVAFLRTGLYGARG